MSKYLLKTIITHIVESMKGLNIIDVVNIKITKKRTIKIDGSFFTTGRHKFIINICYIYNIFIVKNCQY